MTMDGFDSTPLDIRSFRTPGLGDTSYVVIHDGAGLLVDPQRDLDRFLDEFAAADVELRWVVETHLHNDYVSGGVEAARRTGAELVVPAAAAPVYRHTPAFHHEDIAGPGMTIRPIHTPGHTPEHTSYLVLVDGEPIAVFTGGSLLVGSAGRPDLLGPDRAESLARLQHGSVRRLAQLPDEVLLYPTHGEGSFCTASGAGRDSSTIGLEKQTNPVLAYPDEDAFVAGQLGGLQPYPDYYAHMGPANLAGGPAIPGREVPVLSPDELASRLEEVTVVDIRDRHRFAAGHVPGSLGVELRDDFGVWVGWLTDIDDEIVLVADPGQDLDEAIVQLARIGFDRIGGVLWGLDQWSEAGYETTSYRTVDAGEFAAAVHAGEPILDVRSPGEFEEQSLARSRHRYVPDLRDGVSELDGSEEAWLVCATGFRATIAAGLVESHGIRPVVLADAGVSDLCEREADGGEWTALCDPPLQVG